MSFAAAAGLTRLHAEHDRKIIGVLHGEGVGPQLVAICLSLLEAVGETFGHDFEVRSGGLIGLDALREHGEVLPEDVCLFCEEVFSAGGAILAGAGGGRFVYDMRRRFDLFVKFNPLERYPELASEGRVRWRNCSPLDVVVVRDNAGGVYQGYSTIHDEPDGRRVEHRFGYHDRDVARVVGAAARLAAERRGHLTVIVKDAGLPELTRLWFDHARRAAEEHGVELRTLDIDYAVYFFMSEPEAFDVIVVPNLFGDIMADLGGVLCGSRGSTFGGSYSPRGHAVYQTNHGAAYDLRGTDSANPVGQILSLAMMLEENYGLADEAAAIRSAVRRTWSEGWRTADLMAQGRRLAGTSEFSERVIGNLIAPARGAAVG